MNDIIDRIRDTEEVVISFVTPDWSYMTSVLVVAALVIAGTIVLWSALRRNDEWHIEHPGYDTKLHIALPLLLLYASSITCVFLAFTGKAVTWVCAVLLALSAMAVLWLIASRVHVGYGVKEPAPVREVSRKAVTGALVAAVMMTAGIATALVLSITAPLVPLMEEQPTPEAKSAATQALADVAAAVEGAYDVEVLPGNSCWDPRRPSELMFLFEPREKGSERLRAGFLADNDEAWENEKVALFLESAGGGDPDEAPQMRLATSAGVIGCYSILYDGETARLYVDAEYTDLPAPDAFKKDES